jgi:two-component system, NtrC family, response regulator AtoC
VLYEFPDRTVLAAASTPSGDADRGSGRLRLLTPSAPPELESVLPVWDDEVARALRRLSQTVHDRAMVDIYRAAAAAAPSRLPVLLTGETGVGKECLAEFIHVLAARPSDSTASPFVCINCAAMNENLFESELFGHERGAFTGAERCKTGLLEAARNGTVFLDEIGELSLPQQAKLLRALEAGTAVRVGGLEPRQIHARFISATNRDLQAEVERGSFRRDLFHRVAGLSLHIPPLRERPCEILAIAERFVTSACRELDLPLLPLAPDAAQALLSHPWTGNIRELRHALQRGVLFARHDSAIRAEHLRLSSAAEGTMPTATPPVPPQPITEEFPGFPVGTVRSRLTRETILQAIADCGGNQKRAAERLRIGRRTLSRWLDVLRIPRPRKA